MGEAKSLQRKRTAPYESVATPYHRPIGVLDGRGCIQAVLRVLISLFSHWVFNEEITECTCLAEDTGFVDSGGAVYCLRGSVEYWSQDTGLAVHYLH